MNATTTLDILILGGGCAGLSLARELVEQGYLGRVVILEQRTAYTNDRSWSFWSSNNEDDSALAAASWSRWRYSMADGRSSVHSVEDIQYHYVPSDRFYRNASALIDRCPKVDLRLGTTINSIERSGQSLQVRCDDQVFNADFVIDTRPPKRQRLEKSTLFQCFSGQILRLAPGTIKDPATVELMTLMRSDDRGFIFDYLLPMSDQRVLVEATRFSNRIQDHEAMKGDLQRLIQRRGFEALAIEHSEYAVLPMGLPDPDPASSQPDGVVLAGTAAGALRPATGYAYLRIQRWARRCAAEMIRGNGPCPHPKDSRLQRWMDDLFLRVMRQNPDRIPDLFMRLAEQAGPASLVRFLSDRASLTDRIRVIKSLPVKLFLGHLLKT